MVRIAGIEKDSTVDGEGWRLAIFFQGCKHECIGCQNPQTWDFSGGQEVSEEELLKLIDEAFDENPILDGITLSGGDPFFQSDKLLKICKEQKSKGRNIWAYTGFIFDNFLNRSNSNVTDSMVELLNYIDVVVDGPFILNKKTIDIPYVGSSNQRLIDVQKTLKSNSIQLYILED